MLGDAHVGKKHVIQSLIEKTDGSQPLEWKTIEAPPTTYAVQTYTIRTKYYSAPVEFHVSQIKDFEWQEHWSGYEGLILVWDATRKSSWNKMQHVMQRLQDREHGFEVLLAVANRVIPGVVLQNMQDCCLEHGVELVILADTVFEADPINRSAAADTDTVGMDRILEALQCTMWKSMEMRAVEPSSHSRSDPFSQIPAHEESSLHATAAADPARKERTPVAAVEASSMPIAEKAGRAGETEALESENADEALVRAEVEHDIHEGFEALMNEVHRIRTSVRDGKLTDDARRAQAAEMAMKLWTLLGDSDRDNNHEHGSGRRSEYEDEENHDNHDG